MAKAQKGDLIRIIKEKRFNDDDTLDFLLGDIYEVIEVDRDGDVNFHDADGETRYINDHSSYEIHRKAGEEDVPLKINPTATVYYGGKAIMTAEPLVFGEPLTYDLQYDATDEQIRAIIEGGESDAVNSPNHYTQGRFETIEIIEEITQGYSDGFVSYNIGNVLKYIARAPHKHDTPLEDLRKAERYLRYAIERITQK